MSDALTSKLKELREMCEIAPPGPWREGTGGYYANAYGNFEHTDGMRAFVIASRDLVPRLITALEGCVEALEMGAFHHPACPYYETKPCVCAHEKVDAALETLRKVLEAK